MDKKEIKKLILNDKLNYWILAAVTLVILIVGINAILKVVPVDMSVSTDEMAYDQEWNQYEARFYNNFAKGIYDISVSYISTDNVAVEISSSIPGARLFHADAPVLSKYGTDETIAVWLDEKCDSISVKLRAGEGDLRVESVSIKTAANSKAYNITKYLMWFVLFGLVLLCIRLRESIRKNSLVILGLAVIVIVSSAGCLSRFVTMGHDLNFHLLRIEGLKEAILLGDIPPKVQTNWCFGYGYAVSATYGDLTLILPAMMRVLGFTIQSSYKAFIFTMNLLTALTAFFCFIKVGKGEKGIALLATFLYVCAPYRLCCIYIRGAFGEYSGMLFIPLIIYGLYEVYASDSEDADYGRSVLIPVIGFTGLLQTHILSCIMTAIFMFIFMLINWRKTFTKKVFIYLIKIAGFSLLVSLWFLVPMMIFLKEPLRVHIENGYSPDFQLYGLSLTEVFAQHSSGSSSFNWAYVTNLGGRMSMPVGNGFVILLLCFLYFKSKGMLSSRGKIAGVFAILGVLATFMATNLFPYDLIDKKIKVLSKIITRVNIPYRYVTMGIVLFSVFTVYFLTGIKKKIKKKYVMVIMLVCLLVACDQSMDYVYRTLYNAPIAEYNDDVSLYSNGLIGFEYLYEGTNPDRAEYEREITGDSIGYENLKRTANRFDLTITGVGENGYMDFPLYYYPGYEARTEDGSLLEIQRGDNNRIRIAPKSGFTGNISIRYREPLLWRIMEIISLLGLLFIIAMEIRYRYCGGENKITRLFKGKWFRSENNE